MHLNLHNAFHYITKAGISDQSWQLRWDDLDIYKVNKFNRKVWMNIVCQLLTSIVELFFQVSKYYISWDITWQTNSCHQWARIIFILFLYLNKWFWRPSMWPRASQFENKCFFTVTLIHSVDSISLLYSYKYWMKI